MIAARTVRSAVPAMLALACWAPPAPGQRPVFRPGIDAVSVDASVLRGHTPVPGLDSSAFSLLDNGVLQHLDAFATKDLPLDLTIVLDESGSFALFTQQSAGMARQIATLLESADRLRVVAFNTDIWELIPFAPATPNPDIPSIRPGGTSVDDAVVYALITAPRAPDRRRLTVIFTDGLENTSVAGAATLASVVRSADTVIHVVLPGDVAEIMQMSPEMAYRKTLISLATMTGGGPYDLAQHVNHSAGPRSPDDIERAFVASMRHILSDYRQSYVLQYTVHGVPREGWHKIVVTVHGPGADNYTVRARQGYFGG